VNKKKEKRNQKKSREAWYLSAEKKGGEKPTKEDVGVRGKHHGKTRQSREKKNSKTRDSGGPYYNSKKEDPQRNQGPLGGQKIEVGEARPKKKEQRARRRSAISG